MMMDSLEKSAIANLLSDEKLKLVKLDEQEYMEGQIAFRSQQNEQEMMLEATFQTIKKYKYSQENYSILSIGCGSGLFEKPFLTELLELNKSIHFVGVDSNKLGCIKIKEWCHVVNSSQSVEVSFRVSFIKSKIVIKPNTVMRCFLETIIWCSEKAAGLARACRKEKDLFQLLVQVRLIFDEIWFVQNHSLFM